MNSDHVLEECRFKVHIGTGMKENRSTGLHVASRESLASSISIRKLPPQPINYTGAHPCLAPTP